MNLKSILLTGLTACSLALSALTGHAQQNYNTPLTQTNAAMGRLDGTNANAAVPAGTVTNLFIDIPNVSDNDYTTIQVSYKLASSGTEVNNTLIDASSDHTNWVVWAVLPTTSAGTAIATSATNIFWGPMLFGRVRYFTNTSAAAVSNLKINPGQKFRARGR